VEPHLDGGVPPARYMQQSRLTAVMRV
jgi:hypothetical protein